MIKKILYLTVCGLCLTVSNVSKAEETKTVVIQIAENEGAWDKTKNVASDTWEGTKDVTSDVWEGTKNVASDVWEGTKNVASDVKDGVTGNDNKDMVNDADKEHHDN